MNTSIPHQSQAVLDHWFEDGLQLGWPSRNMNAQWFTGGPKEDKLIAERFGPLVKSAQDGQLSDWELQPISRLALLIVLDQYSRNAYRGQAQAFAGDERAQQLVLQSLKQGADEELPTVARVFLYMPLMHAESLALQCESVDRFSRLHASAPPDIRKKLQSHLQSAREHLDIVKRFGRFPHRNATLKRSSTPEEIEFLRTGPRFGQ